MQQISLDEILPELSEMVFTLSEEYTFKVSTKRIFGDTSNITPNIKTGFIPFLLKEEFKSDHVEKKEYWVLTNITTINENEYTRMLVLVPGSLSSIVKLLYSPILGVRETAMHAIGNISSENTQQRDMLLNIGALEPLVDWLNIQAQNRMIRLKEVRLVVWTMSTLCTRSPPPSYHRIGICFSILTKLVYCKDPEILIYTLSALSSITESFSEMIPEIITSYNTIQELIFILDHRSLEIKILTIKTIGNIVASDFQFPHNIMNQLCCALTIYIDNFVQLDQQFLFFVLWTLSNVAAGKSDHIQMVIDSNAIPKLLIIMSSHKDGLNRCKIEAIWVLRHIIAAGNHSHIKYLILNGCCKSLCDLLTIDNTDILNLLLVTLESLSQMITIQFSKDFLIGHIKSSMSSVSFDKLHRLKKQGTYSPIHIVDNLLQYFK
ncbi:putative importin subunit alpha B [Tieghemostelium lacteum]|uniref:Putative importin subunit alpha B n=1 Tax=Tieghemostelium lacteum TaxID=361077 RepID=A0A151Z513_TIELA|nr:putative importin subunit alpha B [Tieghemostelium lacteum]|eukprot:KYQ89063.1 putative importin subunit alpha B [Tieghemostelium lacteum]